MGYVSKGNTLRSAPKIRVAAEGQVSAPIAQSAPSSRTFRDLSDADVAKIATEELARTRLLPADQKPPSPDLDLLKGLPVGAVVYSHAYRSEGGGLKTLTGPLTKNSHGDPGYPTTGSTGRGAEFLALNQFTRIVSTPEATPVTPGAEKPTPRKKKPFNEESVSKRMLARMPVTAWVIENGGIIGKSKSNKKFLSGDLDDSTGAAAFGYFGPKIYRGAQPAADMATAASHEGIVPEGTTSNDLIRIMEAEYLAARKSIETEDTLSGRADHEASTVEGHARVFQDATKKDKGKTQYLAATGDLAAGDIVDAGEAGKFLVEHKDEHGDIFLAPEGAMEDESRKILVENGRPLYLSSPVEKGMETPFSIAEKPTGGIGVATAQRIVDAKIKEFGFTGAKVRVVGYISEKPVDPSAPRKYSKSDAGDTPSQEIARDVGASSRAIQVAQPGTSSRDAEIEAIRRAAAIPWISLETFGEAHTVASEHQIWFKDDKVIKATAYGKFGHSFDGPGKGTPLGYLRRIAAANEAFSDSATIIGKFVDAEGNFGLVHAQDFILGDESKTIATEDQIIAFLEANGFSEDTTSKARGVYVNAELGIEVSDFHPGNFVVSADGKLVPIDVLARKFDPSKGINYSIRRNAAGQIEGYFDPRTGEAVINASAISSPKRAVEVLLHELVGHGGMAVALKGIHPAGYANLLKVLQKFTREDGSSLWADVQARYPGKPETTLFDEALARLAENPARSQREESLFRAILNTIRQWLAKAGITNWSDADINALIRRAADAVRQGEVAGMRESGAQASVRPTVARPEEIARFRELTTGLQTTESVIKKYREDLVLAMNGKLRADKALQLGRAPQTLRLAGLPDGPVYMKQETALGKPKEHKHPYPAFKLLRLAELLQRPILVHESWTEKDAYVALLKAEHEGKNFIAALHFKADGNGIEVTEVSSVYPRDDSQIYEALQRTIENREGRITYFDKEKTRGWLIQHSGFHPPQYWLQTLGRIKTIRTDAGIVNRKLTLP